MPFKISHLTIFCRKWAVTLTVAQTKLPSWSYRIQANRFAGQSWKNPQAIGFLVVLKTVKIFPEWVLQRCSLRAVQTLNFDIFWMDSLLMNSWSSLDYSGHGVTITPNILGCFVGISENQSASFSSASLARTGICGGASQKTSPYSVEDSVGWHCIPGLSSEE